MSTNSPQRSETFDNVSGFGNNFGNENIVNFAAFVWSREGQQLLHTVSNAGAIFTDNFSIAGTEEESDSDTESDSDEASDNASDGSGEGDGASEGDVPVQRFTDEDGTEWVVRGGTRFGQFRDGSTVFHNDQGQEFKYSYDAETGSTDILVGTDIDQLPIHLRQTHEGAYEVVTRQLIFTLSDEDNSVVGFRANESNGYSSVTNEDGSISIIDESGTIVRTLPGGVIAASSTGAESGAASEVIPVSMLGEQSIQIDGTTFTVDGDSVEVVQNGETITVDLLDDSSADGRQPDVQITMDDGSDATHEQAMFLDLANMVLSMDDVTVSRFFSMLHFAGDIVIESPALDVFLERLEELKNRAELDAQRQAANAASRALSAAQAAISLLRSGHFNASTFAALAGAFSEMWAVMQNCSAHGIPVPPNAYTAYSAVCGVFGEASIVNDQQTDLARRGLSSNQIHDISSGGHYFAYINGALPA